MKPNGAARVCGTRSSGFDSHHAPQIAGVKFPGTVSRGLSSSLGEHLPCKQGVTGSSPVGSTKVLKGRINETLDGTTVVATI